MLEGLYTRGDNKSRRGNILAMVYCFVKMDMMNNTSIIK